MSIEIKGLHPVATAIIAGSIAFKPQKILVSIIQPEHIVTATADTERKLAAEDKAQADGKRNVIRNNCVMADTMRWECSYETVDAEMCRCLGVSVHGVADSSREMVCTNEVMADTCRQVTSALQGASVNTLREIYADEQTVAGAVRILARENSLAADVVRNLQATQAGMTKAARYVSKTESATQNFTRQVVKSETAIATTERDLSKWEVACGDTSTILPYHFAIDANKESEGGGDVDDIPQQNIIYVQSVTLSLNERTLADTFQMETTSPLDIESAVQGRLLDFDCNFQVEETSQQGILQTVKGMYPLDRLLYMPINIEVVEANCSYYARKIADALGLSLDLRIEDFTPSQDYSLSGMTYQDFISSLFSWTSRLPQRQINVFIRGRMLHIIQRGHEDQVTDITAWPHTMPTINRKLIRSVWDSATTESWDRARSDKDYEPQPFTGTIGIEGITRHYLNGLLTEEETNGSITEYSYDDQYLTEKRTHNPDGSTVQTTYTYAKTANDIYLFKETEKTTDATQKEGETSHDRNDWTDWLNENFSTRITYHAPIGYGWYSTTVYEDGEFQGSSISQGKPGGKSSQFTINEWNRSLGSDYDFDDDEDDKFKGQALFDTEFPVTGDDFLRELTHEIEWLNRKRQEEVSLDIVSPVIKGHATIRHILDFTERIRLDDKEYFLVSNQVKLTTRSLRQSIRLVRWYG